MDHAIAHHVFAAQAIFDILVAKKKADGSRKYEESELPRITQIAGHVARHKLLLVASGLSNTVAGVPPLCAVEPPLDTLSSWKTPPIVVHLQFIINTFLVRCTTADL